jgi:regulatory protein
MIVVAVRRDARRRRYVVHLDDGSAVTLQDALTLEHNLRPGCAVSVEDLGRLTAADEARSAIDYALRLLSYRPRSERELRQRLKRKGIGQQAVDGAVERLRELGYLDDEAFARSRVQTRQAARPRPGWAVARELRQRGIDGETAKNATDVISDEDAALEAARRRLSRYAALEYPVFRERLGRFLTSRGFSYDVARRTINACWPLDGGVGRAEEAGSSANS